MHDTFHDDRLAACDDARRLRAKPHETINAQENARRTLYMVADKECMILRETIATECRLENINVNVNRMRHPNPETINANASMT